MLDIKKIRQNAQAILQQCDQIESTEREIVTAMDRSESYIYEPGQTLIGDLKELNQRLHFQETVLEGTGKI